MQQRPRYYSDEDIAAMMSADTDEAEQAARVSPRRRPSNTPPVRQGRTSLWDEASRIVLGGLRDAGQGTADSLNDLNEASEQFARNLGDRVLGTNRYIALGSTARNGVVEFGVARSEIERREDARETNRRETGAAGGIRGALTNTVYGDLPSIAEPTSGGGRFARDVVEFGATFVGGARVIRGVGGAGRFATWSRSMAAGAASAFVDVDAMEGNLANMAEDLGVPRNVLMDALSVDEDDSRLVARFKNAAADSVTGLAVDGAFRTLAEGVRAARGFRLFRDGLTRQSTVPDAAMAMPDVVPDVTPVVAPKATPKAPEVPAGTTGPTTPATPGAQGELFDATPVRPPEPADEIARTYFELPRKVASLTKEAVTDLATRIHNGAGFEVLERLGVNPYRMDFEKVLTEGEGPDKVIEMMLRVAEATEPLAMEMGSKPRSWTQTAALANLLGTTEARIVELFADRARNLDGFAWAARSYIAGQAKRLVDMAEVARKYTGSPEAPEYIAFLKQLEVQMALQSTFKGSASSVARTLASLKGVSRASSGIAKAERLKSIIPDAANDASKQALGSAEAALKALADAKSPAQRRALIDAILKNKGDLAKVTRTVERMSGPSRWRRAVREQITAGLFSVGTAAFNILGGTLHISARAISRFAVHPLAYATGQAGKREFVAARLGDTAYVTTFVPSLVKGLGQSLRLLSDDVLSEGAGIAGSAGGNVVERGLQSARKALNDKYGEFRPKFERADVERTREWHISKDTVEAWMQSASHGPAFYRAGMRSLIGLASGAFNTVGTINRGVRLLAIDIPDELIGTTVFNAQRAAEATRLAAVEGFDRGLKGKELADYTAKRAKVLAQNTSSEAMDRMEKLIASGAKTDSEEVIDLAKEAQRTLQIENLSEAEARKVLFQDDLNWGISKSASQFLPYLDGKTGLIIPFINTPLKILETVVEDFTPLGLLRKDLREKLLSGGPDGMAVAAQMALGATVVGAAYAAAASGDLVGYDGGYKSSTRLTRPQYSMRMGDSWVEYGRADPAGMILGFGADLFHYQQKLDEEDPEVTPSLLNKWAYGTMMAITRNVLSKTWLTSLREIGGLVAGGDAQTQSGWDRLMTSMIQKVVPAGGMQRWWDGEDVNATREANTLQERLMASFAFTADDLPIKRDPLLGRPVPYDRVLGVKVAGEKDALLDELSDLGFDLPPDSKSFRGVRLTSPQLARLKELRGQVVTISGYTFESRLQDAIERPEWGEMTRAQKLRYITRWRTRYHREAMDALMDEDRSFGAEVAVTKRRKRLEEDGTDGELLGAELSRFREELLQTQ